QMGRRVGAAPAPEPVQGSLEDPDSEAVAALTVEPDAAEPFAGLQEVVGGMEVLPGDEQGDEHGLGMHVEAGQLGTVSRTSMARGRCPCARRIRANPKAALT